MRPKHLVERVEHLGDAQVLDVVDRAGKAGPERFEHILPRHLVVGDAVEVFFQLGGEVVFDVAREILLQERDHDAALVLAVQPLLVEPHIAAIAQDLQDRCVGRRTADAEFFHALDQRGFREARRRLGEMLGDGERLTLQRLAVAHGGQAVAVFIVRIVVAAFLIEFQEAVELDHLAAGAQVERARARLGDDINSGALEFGRFHLARHGANPDQFVEPRLVIIEAAAQIGRAACDVGGADGFVRFLRVFRLGLILARRIRHVILAVILADHLAGLSDRGAIDLHAVGTHISNETGGLATDVDALIKPLRDAHGVRRREAELAAGLLLQGRSGEGRVGIAPRRLGLDAADGKVRRLDGTLEVFGFRAAADVEPRQLLAVGADQARLEGVAARRRQGRDQRPVFTRDETLDFLLAVADQP